MLRVIVVEDSPTPAQHLGFILEEARILKLSSPPTPKPASGSSQ